MNDYDTFLLGAVSTLPENGTQDREKLYESLRRELDAKLRQALVGKTEAEIAEEEIAFDAAIKRTEGAIKSDVDDLFLPPLPELYISHETANDNHSASIGIDHESIERRPKVGFGWSREHTVRVTRTRSIRETYLGIRKLLVRLAYVVAAAGLIFAVLIVRSITQR
jgi:hypothetical protein